MRPFRAPALLSAFATLLSTFTFAVQPDRIAGAIDSSRMVSLTRGIHPKAQPRYDQGTVEPSFRMDYVTLQTVPSASQQQELNRLIAEQQDPKSPNYHKWLTPEQYAERFGLSRNDVERITTWLKSQGLSIVKVARGRNWIVFSGTAAQIQSAFQTEIHRYNVDGEMHFANASAPSIPAALSGVATGLRGLHDFRPSPRGIRRNSAIHPDWNSATLGDLVAPGDIATVYNINALYTSGIDGTGQKLAVAGQTDIYLADLAKFRSGFGLSAINCTTNSNKVITSCNTSNFQYVLTGPDPGISTHGDVAEADLDLEWSGATARNAKIIYVNSNNAFDSYYYAIDQNLAPVISLSYGTCELFDQGFIVGDEAELTKGNSEGITIVNSSGDSGAAECDFSTNLATHGLAASYPASSPEVTGIGGTAVDLANFSSTYWGTTNATDGGTALSYIPEIAWNDDAEIGEFCQQNPTNSFCSKNGITDARSAQNTIGISSTGGGPSNCFTVDNAGACNGGFAKPSWQTVTVPGQGNVRLTPDVSFFASPNFPGFIFCTPLNQIGGTGTTSSCANGIKSAVDTHFSIIGGTSASAPVFAGIISLLNQYFGTPGLGNVNPTLYSLALTPSNNAFHRSTGGNNLVYCLPGTPAGQPAALQCPNTGVFGYDVSTADTTTGYNLVTGLGSVDVNNLAIAWAATLPHFSLSANGSSVSVTAGHSGTSTVSITPVNGFSGTVTFSCSGLPTGATCSFSPASSTGSTTLTLQTVANMALATTSVTVKGTSGTLVSTTPVSLTVTTTDQSFTFVPRVSSVSVSRGTPGSVTFDITPDPTNGFNGTLTFSNSSCSGMPSESSCQFSPPSVILSGTTPTTVTLNFATTKPVTQLRLPLDRGSQIFYAALLPGLFGIVLTAGSRRRVSRGVRLLGLIVVLGVSTLWLGACGGGGGNTNKDPGTPTGSYPIVVTATTGGTNPVSQTANVTLNVN